MSRVSDESRLDQGHTDSLGVVVVPLQGQVKRLAVLDQGRPANNIALSDLRDTSVVFVVNSAESSTTTNDCTFQSDLIRSFKVNRSSLRGSMREEIRRAKPLDTELCWELSLPIFNWATVGV